QRFRIACRLMQQVDILNAVTHDFEAYRWQGAIDPEAFAWIEGASGGAFASEPRILAGISGKPFDEAAHTAHPGAVEVVQHGAAGRGDSGVSTIGHNDIAASDDARYLARVPRAESVADPEV